MIEPKILIGAPIFDGNAHAMKQYIERLQQLTYKHADYLLVDNSSKEDFFIQLQKKGVHVVRDFSTLPTPKERLVAARNYLRQKAIDEGYDYFFSLEQDVIPPVNVIEALLRHGKKVVSGVYCNYFTNARGQKELLPIAYRDLMEQERKSIVDNKEKFKEINPETYETLAQNNFDFSKVRKNLTLSEVSGNQLFAVKAAGLGCMLIHRSVLEKISFRVNPSLGFDDVLFCEDVYKQKESVYLDPLVKCVHLVEKKPWKWTLHS